MKILKNYSIPALLIISGCTGYNNAEPQKPDTIGELNKYAATLALNTEKNIFDPVVIATDSNYYVIEFKTSNPDLIGEDGPNAYKRNIVKTAAWNVKFCTPELKSIVINNSISMVTGKLISSINKAALGPISLCRASTSTVEENLQYIQETIERNKSKR